MFFKKKEDKFIDISDFRSVCMTILERLLNSRLCTTGNSNCCSPLSIPCFPFVSSYLLLIFPLYTITHGANWRDDYNVSVGNKEIKSTLDNLTDDGHSLHYSLIRSLLPGLKLRFFKRSLQQPDIHTYVYTSVLDIFRFYMVYPLKQYILELFR